jgi:hypothetical protein
MKIFYRAAPVLQGGGEYYAATAEGAMAKAVAEAKEWIAHNRLDGEVWSIRIEVYLDLPYSSKRVL